MSILMAMWVGTSGYNYPEWRGTFYPEKLPEAQMLSYYAGHFSTVEINYTYYRFPNAKTLESWNIATPEKFAFTLKAPKRITHDARLKDCGENVRYFCEVSQRLGAKLGVLFFQLPPSLKYDAALFDDFLATVPEGTRAAFEFRHGSWLCDDVYDRLRRHQLALCVADSETMATPITITAEYAYFRLRDQGYTSAELIRWAENVREKTHACQDVYVYFKHEEEGTGPQFAMTFIDALTR